MGCFGCFAPAPRRGGGGDLKPSKLAHHCTDDDSEEGGAGCGERLRAQLHLQGFAGGHRLLKRGQFHRRGRLRQGVQGKISKTNSQGASDAQMVAVKQLAWESVQGRKEFLVEVLMLTVLSHPNLVSLVSFCAQGDERLLASLNHAHDDSNRPQL